MSTKGEVASKILEGKLITEEEFVEARVSGIYKPHLSYDDLKATYYQDHKRQGYICSKHENPINKGENGVEWHCGFGLHVPDLRLGNLTYGNIGFLVMAFGRDVLDRIPRDIKERR